ncbi:MAG: hypothetical protein ACFCUJ_10050 [Thiotrichales bacterium]
MNRVILHIDRLVLRGVAPDDRVAVAAALQAELTRLLASPDGAARFTPWDRHARVRLGAIDLPDAPRPTQLGAAVARRIVGGGQQ